MPKNISRIQILSAILSFPQLGNHNWKGGFSSEFNDLQIGDLVSLNSSPPSKWYASWLIEKNYNNGWPKYLLESIDDGELCWWENVGVNYYDRERVLNNPQWRWTDKQHKFNSRWLRTCYKKHDAYIVVPVQAEFLEDYSVRLQTRIRHGFSDHKGEMIFKDWRKTTIAMMSNFYLSSAREYESQDAA